MLENRINANFLNNHIRHTMRILEVLTQNFPEPVTVEDVSLITDIPMAFVEECLINLAYDEYVRETENGFQQIGLKVEKLSASDYRILDGWFTDNNEPKPKMRDKNGSWL